GPVVAPSANPSGTISPTSTDHVAAGLDGQIDMVLDGGNCPVGVESTIVSCLTDKPQILRHGGLVRGDIEAVLGVAIADGAENAEKPTAPGQLLSHYAPRASVRLNVVELHDGETLLGFGPEAGNTGFNLSATGNLSEAAANLFKMLHLLDAQGVEKIAVSPIPADGLGEAINDRLRRAAAPRC
ncbi:MAG TPA: translation factor Sua5, partial [Rhizobiales bacterium]|nr:translation factor Sua5 [Hyphomicrobiales bacterium]